jgi:hypothetical protein
MTDNSMSRTNGGEFRQILFQEIMVNAKVEKLRNKREDAHVNPIDNYKNVKLEAFTYFAATEA